MADNVGIFKVGGGWTAGCSALLTHKGSAMKRLGETAFVNMAAWWLVRRL